MKSYIKNCAKGYIKGTLCILPAVILIFIMASCGKKTAGEFSYSEIFADNGYFSGVKAAKVITPYDYTALSIPEDVSTVADETVQVEIDYIKEYYQISSQIYDRAIENGDLVNIDYVGSVDGVEFSGGSTSGQGAVVTAGSIEYIDDFLTQIIGHMPGETVNVEVTFPEDYGVEELNGKDALFVTTINYIAGEADLTDEDVMTYLNADSGWTTVEEAMEGIRVELQKNAVLSYIIDQINSYINDLPDSKKIPSKIIKYYERSLVNYYQTEADTNAMSLEAYLIQNLGVTNAEELIKENESTNRHNAAYCLVLQAIAESNSLEVTDADLASYFKEMTGSEDYAEYEALYGKPYLKQAAMQQKTLEFIASTVMS